MLIVIFLLSLILIIGVVNLFKKCNCTKSKSKSKSKSNLSYTLSGDEFDPNCPELTYKYACIDDPRPPPPGKLTSGTICVKVHGVYKTLEDCQKVCLNPDNVRCGF